MNYPLIPLYNDDNKDLFVSVAELPAKTVEVDGTTFATSAFKPNVREIDLIARSYIPSGLKNQELHLEDSVELKSIYLNLNGKVIEVDVSTNDSKVFFYNGLDNFHVRTLRFQGMLRDVEILGEEATLAFELHAQCDLQSASYQSSTSDKKDRISLKAINAQYLSQEVLDIVERSYVFGYTIKATVYEV